MMAKGLGSGLGALFGEEALQETESEVRLPIAKIEPRADQPRTVFDEQKLAELADSIRDHGLIQPVVVRAIDGGYYQIIAGERRWRAARIAGLKEVPVRIIEADDRKTAELALIENLQREDLSPVEEGRGYQTLMDNFGMTQEIVAETVGKSRPVVANALRILKLPEEILDLIDKKRLGLSHARALLELDDPDQQIYVAHMTANYDYSVRQTTQMVRNLRKMSKPQPEKKNPRLGTDGVDYMAEVERELSDRLGRRVRVNAGTRKGRIEIEYCDAEDFETLYNALKSIKGGTE